MRKIIPALVAGAAVLAVTGTAYGYVALDKDVRLSVDGASSRISTMAGTVGEVLQSRGIELGEHDVVTPRLDARLSDGTQIVVHYGRQIRVTVDGQQQTFWTTATHVDEALATIDLESEGAALSTGRSTPIGRSGLSFGVATRKTITVDVAGKRKKITTTAQTVGAALSDAEVDIDDDDLLSTSEDTLLRNGSSFTVTKVEVRRVTRKQPVAYRTVFRDSRRLEKGTTEVETEGRAGVREIEVREVRHDGKLQSREQTASTLTTPPRTAIVLRGTKKPEPKEDSQQDPEPRAGSNSESDPKPRPHPGDDADTDSDAGPDPKNSTDERGEASGNGDDGPEDRSGNSTQDSADSTSENRADDDQADDRADDDPGNDREEEGIESSESGARSGKSAEEGTVWDRLAECESGQRWDIDSGNGLHGGLQFTPQTWKAYGGTDYAPLAGGATREQQIAVAERVRDDIGWSSWPACSLELGLR